MTLIVKQVFYFECRINSKVVGVINQSDAVLKAVAESIYRSIATSGGKEISNFDWDNLCVILNLKHDTIYCIESTTNGFEIKTRRISFVYKHAPVRYQTEVAVKRNSYPIPVKLPFKQIEIKIHAVDGYGDVAKSFRNVHELAEFLKDNEAYAKALGYVPKAK
jgi:hypothetical protein